MSVNPQTTNTLNNTEKNTFNITPTLSQLGQTIGENIAPIFTQPSGIFYIGESNASEFNFAGTTNNTIFSVSGSYIFPKFQPSSTSGTLTIQNAYASSIDCLVAPGTNGVVTNAYSLFVGTPSGAINKYTAVFGVDNTALVGIGTITPHQALSVDGGISYSVTPVTTATYTALNTDNTLDVNFGGAVTITLPAASAANNGQIFFIKDASGLAQTNNITIVTLGGNIDGASSAVINVNYGFLQAYSDGVNYFLSISKLGTTNLSVTNVTTPTFTATNAETILNVNNPAPVAVTLPAASPANSGQTFFIKDTSGAAQTNPITINTLGGTIDGTTSQVIQANYGFLEVYSDGTNYHIADSEIAPAPGPSWINVTGTSQALSVDTGYLTTNSAATTLTLPTTAAFGSIITVTGGGTGLFTIAQNAGQQIQIGNLATTVGVLGSLSSTSKGDTIKLLCSAANTSFQVLDAVGNLIVS